MMRDDFGVFILSHGRPSRVKTLKSLEKGRYTGKWWIVIDNEDDTAPEYYKRYKDRVIMFDKLEVSKTFDTADTSQERRTIVYARNACFAIAKELGLEYFLELDDDYTSFEYRVIRDKKFIEIAAKQLDDLFSAMINFLDDTGAITVAFAQSGDFIGGKDSKFYHDKVSRKAMNTFFCRVSSPFQFVGRINEDVNTYTSLGSKGKLILTISDASITQVQTQAGKGGMTDVYLDSGTYLKTFYTVIFSPSCTKVGMMGDKHKRIHHMIDWDRCVPKILNEKWKKT